MKFGLACGQQKVNTFIYAYQLHSNMQQYTYVAGPRISHLHSHASQSVRERRNEERRHEAMNEAAHAQL